MNISRTQWKSKSIKNVLTRTYTECPQRQRAGAARFGKPHCHCFLEQNRNTAAIKVNNTLLLAELFNCLHQQRRVSLKTYRSRMLRTKNLIVSKNRTFVKAERFVTVRVTLSK